MKSILKAGFWQCLGLAITYLFLGLVALLIAIPKMLWGIGVFIVKSTFGWLVGLFLVIGIVVAIFLVIVL